MKGSFVLSLLPIIQECSTFFNVNLFELLVDREILHSVMLPKHYLLWHLPGENVDDILLRLPDDRHQVPRNKQCLVVPLLGVYLK